MLRRSYRLTSSLSGGSSHVSPAKLSMINCRNKTPFETKLFSRMREQRSNRRTQASEQGAQQLGHTHTRLQPQIRRHRQSQAVLSEKEKS